MPFNEIEWCKGTTTCDAAVNRPIMGLTIVARRATQPF
jgi:hypothetical protein